MRNAVATRLRYWRLRLDEAAAAREWASKRGRSSRPLRARSARRTTRDRLAFQLDEWRSRRRSRRAPLLARRTRRPDVEPRGPRRPRHRLGLGGRALRVASVGALGLCFVAAVAMIGLFTGSGGGSVAAAGAPVGPNAEEPPAATVAPPVRRDSRAAERTRRKRAARARARRKMAGGRARREIAGGRARREMARGRARRGTARGRPEKAASTPLRSAAETAPEPPQTTAPPPPQPPAPPPAPIRTESAPSPAPAPAPAPKPRPQPGVVFDVER